MGLGDGAIWAQVKEFVERITRKCGDDNARGLAEARIPHFRGFGKVCKVTESSVEVEVAFRRRKERSGGSLGTLVRGKHALIATGSEAVRFECLDYDATCVGGHRRFYDSDSIKSLSFLPRKVVIVGGGIIAVEFARIRVAKGCDRPPFEGSLRISLEACSCPYSGFTSSYEFGSPR